MVLKLCAYFFLVHKLLPGNQIGCQALFGSAGGGLEWRAVPALTILSCLPGGCKSHNEPVGKKPFIRIKGNIMNQDEVMLYALSTCGHCKDMKAFLGQCGVNYDCVDVDKLEEAERKQVIEKLIQISRECAFPTLIVGDQVIVGFRKEEVKELLGIS
jgi:glutaredoxin-like protein NrdH